MSTPMLILGAAPLQVVTNGSLLASGNALVTGSIYNATGQTLGGYPLGQLTLVFTMAAAPTAGTGIYVYTLCAIDPTSNTNYEDGSASPLVIPTKDPAGILALDSGVTSYSRGLGAPILLPPGYFKLMFWNNGTGQSLQANWNASLAPWSVGF